MNIQCFFLISKHITLIGKPFTTLGVEQAQPSSDCGKSKNRTNVDPTLDTKFLLSADNRNDNDILRWYNTGFQRSTNTGNQHIFNVGYQHL